MGLSETQTFFAGVIQKNKKICISSFELNITFMRFQDGPIRLKAWVDVAGVKTVLNIIIVHFMIFMVLILRS